MNIRSKMLLGMMIVSGLLFQNSVFGTMTGVDYYGIEHTYESFEDVIVGITKDKLTSLDIYGNNIGDAGAQAFAEALMNENCKLTSLNIGHNKIGTAGAQAMAEALMNENCNLTSLDIRKNNIGDDGARSIAGALKFNLDENKKLLEELKENTNLIKMKEGKKGKNSHTNIINLNISTNDISNKDIIKEIKGYLIENRKMYKEINNFEFVFQDFIF